MGQPVESDSIQPSAFPPCMEDIVNAIHAHEKISNEASFAIVAFLSEIGMGSDAIIDELFSGVSDSVKGVTEYQIEHIAGERGNEGLAQADCSGLQDAGLCPMLVREDADWDPICAQADMTEPGTYYHRAKSTEDEVSR